MSNHLVVDGKIFKKIIDKLSEVKELPLDKVIMLMGIDDCGNRMSAALSTYFSALKNGTVVDEQSLFKGFTKNIIESFVNENGKYRLELNSVINRLESEYGIRIVYQEKKKEGDLEMKRFEATGSPKEAGYKVKDEFFKKALDAGFEHSSLDAKCTYLLTDSYASTSSKMAKAKKLGVEIISYEDFIKRHLND